MRERTNVLIVGDYPPPYGGLSVQVSVLRGLLDASGAHRCRVLDIGESRRNACPRAPRSSSAAGCSGTLPRSG